MKILCMCQGGNSRSVALAYLLKKMKHDAIAIGMLSASRETRKMLYDWSDLVIVVVGDKKKHWIPEEYHYKVKILNVGPDVFFRGFDHSLLETYKDYLKRENITKI